MKVAVCLSGQTRSIEKGYPSILKYLVEPYQADVFIHTWDLNVDGRFANAKPFQTKSKTDILHELKPIVLGIENFEYTKKQFKNISGNISPMFYSIARANSFKQQYERDFNFKYDLIIRSRMDSMYEETIPQNEIDECLNKDLVFVRFSGINKNEYSCRQNFNFCGQPFVADNFAFGNPKTMDVYSRAYFNLEKFNSNVPEINLGLQLRENKIEYKWSNIKFKSLVHWDQNHCIYESDYEQKEQIFV
jgi:hypothetical protein